MKRVAFVVTAIALLLAACKGGGSNSSPTAPSGQSPATTFHGTIAGIGAQSGTADISIQTTVASPSSLLSSFFRSSFVTALYAQTASSVAATGTVHVAGGSTTSLSGTFTSSTNAVSLSGGAFTLTGSIASGVLSGTYTGPNSGVGGFSALNSTSNTITRFCGSWTSGSGESGIWNLQTSTNGTLSGVGIANVPPPVFLTGQLNGNTLTITTSEGGTGTGTVQGGTVTGNGRSGGRGENSISFRGTTSACQ